MYEVSIFFDREEDASKFVAAMTEVMNLDESRIESVNRVGNIIVDVCVVSDLIWYSDVLRWLKASELSADDIHDFDVCHFC